MRPERVEATQRAVDTHGYADCVMTLAPLPGFDLCHWLTELKQRGLFVPRGVAVQAEIAAVYEARVDRAPKGDRRQVMAPESIRRVAPTRLEKINSRGVFGFPLESYASQLLPSQPAAKASGAG
ncbi:MAG: Tn3 family transposase [Rhodanobacteraceae bacterium]|nr:Tn3 family transposase [Rhodanobacteraceae bacterium]